MIKKVVTYKNYNDVEVQEACYFNFTEAELTEMEMIQEGGLSETLKAIAASQNQPELFKFFKKLILDAYGIKSPDGNRHLKSPEIRDEFEHSLAYNVVFMELVRNTDAAVDFVNALIPASLKEKQPAN